MEKYPILRILVSEMSFNAVKKLEFPRFEMIKNVNSGQELQRWKIVLTGREMNKTIVENPIIIL